MEDGGGVMVRVLESFSFRLWWGGDGEGVGKYNDWTDSNHPILTYFPTSCFLKIKSNVIKSVCL